MSVPTVEATHPRCDSEGCPEGRAYPQRKEGEPWRIIAKLSSVSIPQSCVMQWPSLRPDARENCDSSVRSQTRSRPPESSLPGWQLVTKNCISATRQGRQDTGCIDRSSSSASPASSWHHRCCLYGQVTGKNQPSRCRRLGKGAARRRPDPGVGAGG